ncbi:hypothetical protein CYLTODRAFT_426124 [Cylindrobasidium torrendii FP15055 ss-10]|nr:hypothetical protein CYLTODRAFT_427484 [Cylindrobasidium torrendii FP15055 ss-10]KIY62702.1 hypothetical protein CYLTODRAFT_167026 [Cylindrobasidium torrendii FP15055 ss-10]KIY63402.1 hypothetical protein CYLTODRAFT_426124 [Cylindrobasidium torrendii FP15055 ss-10]
MPQSLPDEGMEAGKARNAGGRSRATRSSPRKASAVARKGGVRTRRSNDTQLNFQSTARAHKTAVRALVKLDRKRVRSTQSFPPPKRQRRSSASNGPRKASGASLEDHPGGEEEAEEAIDEFIVTGILSHRWDDKNQLFYTVEWGSSGDKEEVPSEEPLSSLTPAADGEGGCLSLLNRYHELNGMSMKVCRATRRHPQTWEVHADKHSDERTPVPAFVTDVQGGMESAGCEEDSGDDSSGGVEDHSGEEDNDAGGVAVEQATDTGSRMTLRKR